MASVLVLRPEPGASATMKRAREHGFEPICVPLFEIEPVAWEAPEPGRFDGLLVTSANAIRMGGRNLHKLKALEVFAVGDATAAAARNAGFSVGAVGKSGIDELLEMLGPRRLRLLHLCGEDRREPTSQSQEVLPLIVYRARPTEATGLSSARDVIALVHSPRAAQRLAELVAEKATVHVAAISEAAASAAGRGWKSLEVAPEPTDDALLALAARLCNKPDPE